MVSFNLFARGLTMCLAFSFCTSEVNRDNYNVLITKLNDRHISDGGGSYIEHENDGIEARISAKSAAFCENGPNSVKQYENQEKYMETAKKGDESTEDSIFAKGLRDIRYFFDECRKKIFHRLERKSGFEKRFKIESDLFKFREKIHLLYNCMKITSFRHLDDFLSGDVIPVMNHFELVRNDGNETAIFHDSKLNTKIYVADILNKNWTDLLAERIEKLFKGHSLKIHLDENESQVSGRGRRRDHRMFAMMIMGFVIMASILVPMGFQFLTVLGGKSLLMAKMALIMSAINGLKKIATSNVGYGLYHAPETFHHDPHHHGFHEKIFHIKPQEQPNSPFNIVI